MTIESQGRNFNNLFQIVRNYSSMLSGPSLSRFRKNLLAWFGHSRRDLPWRRTSDPYRIWLSEIMLQQTRVNAVIPYYEKFLARFPDIDSLAEAPEEEVLRLWSGLGYYSRARNLQKAAQQIVARHNSKFPDSLEEALALPGVGDYTAAAILSIAYGKELAALDGNVARVLARLGAIRGDLRSGKLWQQLQKTAGALLAPRAPGDWNQAIMEFGATLCTPRSPQCLLCPISEFCQARKLGLAGVIPEKRAKRAGVELTLASLVLVDRQAHTLLLSPPKSSSNSARAADLPALLSRLWHFPTINVLQNPVVELRSFLLARLLEGQPPESSLRALPKVRHTVTYRHIMVLPFRLDVAALPRVPGSKRLPLARLSAVPISNLTRKVARAALSANETLGASHQHDWP
jgi:A/G-specific adenine glycosylase